MGRYQPSSSSDRRAGYNEAPEFHPIWRGVGFALIILIPVISYFAGLILIEENSLHNYVSIPPDLIPPNSLQILPNLIIPIGDPMLIVKIIITIAISFVIYMVFMLITFLSYRLFGLARYGPTDPPPPRRKIHRRY
jgi:hypothetical protein